MEIESLTGRVIEDLSSFDDQGEVLYPPGTRFYVTHKHYDRRDGSWHIKMKEIE